MKVKFRCNMRVAQGGRCRAVLVANFLSSGFSQVNSNSNSKQAV